MKHLMKNRSEERLYCYPYPYSLHVDQRYLPLDLRITAVWRDELQVWRSSLPHKGEEH